MQNDAFTAGVEPGGLQSKDEIRILLCYLLTSVGVPLHKEAILQSVQANGLANYFEVTDALEALCENGNLTRGKDGAYCATEQAREIARQLDTALPYSVREKAVGAAIALLAQARRERENTVELKKEPHGYRVVCHVAGAGEHEDLMTLSLRVADRRQAKRVREVFQAAPDRVYQMMLALLTGQKELAASYLEPEAAPEMPPPPAKA